MTARYIASTPLHIACALAAIGIYIAVVALAVTRA